MSKSNMIILSDVDGEDNIQMANAFSINIPEISDRSEIKKISIY